MEFVALTPRHLTSEGAAAAKLSPAEAFVDPRLQVIVFLLAWKEIKEVKQELALQFQHST